MHTFDIPPDARNLIDQFVPATIGLLTREFPNGLALQLTDKSDLRRPSDLHPAFYGCYDWHSAVHSHWQVVRALRLFPDASWAADARAAIDRSLSADNIAAEMAYLENRPGFEMPYGMAWVLQLSAEVRAWNDSGVQRWYTALKPLEQHAIGRFHAYLSKMRYPVRSGTHNQTAFALGLAFDWARAAGDDRLSAAINSRAMTYYGSDAAAPLAYEPSGTDFLSPALAEADLMRRVLSGAAFAVWLGRFMPGLSAETPVFPLEPVGVIDPSDGQLAHFAGLNLSRAWVLQAIAAALPDDDDRQSILTKSARRHAAAGLPYALHPDYMMSHWVPSFALYLLTS